MQIGGSARSLFRAKAPDGKLVLELVRPSPVEVTAQRMVMDRQLLKGW